MKEKESFIRKIPGFRSGSKIKMAVAGLVYFILIMGVIGALVSPDKSSATTSPSKEAAKQEEKIYSINEPIEVADVTYKVTDITTLPAIGTSVLSKAADGIYVIVFLDVKNNKNREIVLRTNDFKLTDDKRRTYNTDFTASVYLKAMGYEPFIIKPLGAGLSTSGGIVFDVPANDTGLVLIFGEDLFNEAKSVKIGDVSKLG